ncbi:MAG: PEP-CTERM sorting domain-containing protein [Verrucomicrobiales bacterium]
MIPLHIRFLLGTLPAVLWSGQAMAMTLLIGSTNLEYGHASAIADTDGALVPSGTGFLAVGAFGDLDDSRIRSAVQEPSALRDVLGQFQQLGNSQRLGLGEGLEYIDGAFQAAISAPTRAGDGLVGRPVYVVGGTDRGIFIYKSSQTFQADYPLASGSVEMWGDGGQLSAGLLVGQAGESIEVLDLGSSGASVRLAPVELGADVLARFESTMAPAPKPAPAAEEPVPPAATELPADPVAMPPTLSAEEPASEVNPDVSLRIPARVVDPSLAPHWPPLEIELSVVSFWSDAQITDVASLWHIELLFHDFHPLDGLTVASTSSGADFGSIATTTAFQFSSFRGTAVPEPGTLILLAGAGLIGWIGRRRET